MIISHRHKFIFIKTKKTAGTSIEVFLSQHCGDDDVVTPILPAEAGHKPRNHRGFYNHMPADEVRQRVGGGIWKDYITFCVERSPWEKFLSYYFMLKNSPHHGRHKALSIDEYLDSGPFPLNYPLYTDADRSKIIVKNIIKYEDLDAGLRGVLRPLGIEFGNDLGAKAKGDWRSDRRPYWQILTDRQIVRISEIALKEIDLHGYQAAPASHVNNDPVPDSEPAENIG